MNRAHRWYCRSPHWASVLDWLVPWALDGVDLGDHVLELGAGAGLVTPQLLSRAGRVTAIDVDRPATGPNRRVPRLDVVCADATALPFVQRTFSAVVACAMIHHVPTAASQQRLFREAHRALRPGGVFVGVEVIFNFAMRLFHFGDRYAPVAPDTLRLQLAAAGFSDIVGRRRGRHFTVWARASE